MEVEAVDLAPVSHENDDARKLHRTKQLIWMTVFTICMESGDPHKRWH